MHIFSGQRFHYNPLEGCVSGAYFGRSKKGWMTTELFYGWGANHFNLNIPPGRPVVLLVDGHSTHIDIEISKFCSKSGILLYCLPAHSSHITQPLDVGFYGPLKQAWKKAVVEYSSNNIGKSVTKQTFAKVFKVAWENTVKVSTIVNSFRCAGIFPVDFSVIRPEKLAPATVYTTVPAPSIPEGGQVPAHTKPEPAQVKQTSEVAVVSAPSKSGSPEAKKASEVALEAFESALDRQTRKKFMVRLEEGYDLDNDELYSVWMKLKCLSIDDKASLPKEASGKQHKLELHRELRSSVRSTKEGNGERNTQKSGSLTRQSQPEKKQKKTTALVTRQHQPEEKQQPVTRQSQPEETQEKTSSPVTGQGQKCEVLQSSWDDILLYPKQIPRKKTKAGTSDFPAHISSEQMIEYLRQKEEKKQAEEEAKRKRKEDRELKRQQREAQKQQKAKGKKVPRQTRRKAVSTTSQSDEDVMCPPCSNGSDHRDGWICCDNCDTWFHKVCTDIPSDEYDDLSDVDWYCSACM